MLKTISIVLPEKLIRQVDANVTQGEFSSRSEFFRVLLLMWFLKSDQELGSHLADASMKNEPNEVDLEYGIPPELLNKFVEKAKLLNK